MKYSENLASRLPVAASTKTLWKSKGIIPDTYRASYQLLSSNEKEELDKFMGIDFINSLAMCREAGIPEGTWHTARSKEYWPQAPKLWKLWQQYDKIKRQIQRARKRFKESDRLSQGEDVDNTLYLALLFQPWLKKNLFSKSNNFDSNFLSYMAKRAKLKPENQAKVVNILNSIIPE